MHIGLGPRNENSRGIIIAGVYHAHGFVKEIGRKMKFSTPGPRETAFLYQRISVAIQHYNAVCLTNTFISDPLLSS